MQLRLEMAESPAPAVALWELVGEPQRQTAMALLAVLIAQTVVPEAAGDERVSLPSAGTAGRENREPGRWWGSGAGDGVSE
ncbi:MAG: hypothetical protein ACYCXW_19500 [Solirubrobacteraceae bacterium]